MKQNFLGNFNTALLKKLLEYSLDIIDNSNIGHSVFGMHGLHLNEHGIGYGFKFC